MDGDGEDRPVELKSLIKKVLENPSKSVVAKRIKDPKVYFSNSYILGIKLLL